ncbi:MAG: PPE family protein [Mycobacteriaceae bacterium]|nr:PPE family protein [Mycobacteriaceae bacterium]
MDFGILSPEITSALINSGPGAGSLVQAAAGWQRLSVLLEDAAAADAAVLSSLSVMWHGTSAMAMIDATEPYLEWLRATAQQCHQIGLSAQSAAAAFTTAQATVIGLPQVCANRTQLAHLIATNRFGINLTAIAAAEAEYEGMWVNNSEAMYRYAAASARAVELPQFSFPPAVAGSAGPVAQASTTLAAPASVASLISSLAAPGDLVNNAWFQLANTWGNQFLSSGFPFDLLSGWGQLWQSQSVQTALDMSMSGVGGDAAEMSQAKLVGAVRAPAAPTAALAAGVSMGKLTVPPAVVGLLPAAQAQVRLASVATPLSAADAGFAGMPTVLPPPISAGTGWRKRKQKYDDIEIGLELPGTIMHRPPSGG